MCKTEPITHIFKKLTLSVWFLLLMLLSFHPTTLAQENLPKKTFDLSVSPPTAYLKIHPGNIAVHSITLKNNGLSPLSVTPQLVDFSANGITGQPVLADTHTFPYLDLDRTSFESLVLQPDQTAQLTLHFSVPSTAEDREYPLTLLFRGNQISSDTSNTLTPLAGVIASNLIVLVSDNESLQNIFSVDTFNSAPLVDSFSQVSFAPVIKNNSFAAAVASGSATITNWQGTKVAQFEISPSVILGYSSRQVGPVSAGSDQVDTSRITDTFTYDAPLLIGPYTISVMLPSGEQLSPSYTEHKIIVWAIPLALIAAIVLTCFALALYYFYKKRNPFY